MPFKKTHKAISRNPLYCPHMALNISRGFPSFLVAQLDFSLSSFAPEKRSRGVTSHRKEKVALARGKVHKLPSREKKQTNKQANENKQPKPFRAGEGDRCITQSDPSAKKCPGQVASFLPAVTLSQCSMYTCSQTTADLPRGQN